MIAEFEGATNKDQLLAALQSAAPRPGRRLRAGRLRPRESWFFSFPRVTRLTEEPGAIPVTGGRSQ